MYGVVHTSKVKATKVGHIYSVVSAEDVQNGSVGYVGDLKENETEVREFLKPTTELLPGELVIIATPELIYNEDRMASGSLGKFINEKGLAMVAIPLEKGDELEISTNMIDALATKPVKGNYLVPQNGSYKLKEQSSKPSSGVYAKIDYLKTSGVATFVDSTGKKAGNVYDLVHITLK